MWINDKSLSRMEEVDFSLPIFVDGGSYLSPWASGIRNLKDLAGKKIAVTVGTTTEQSLAELGAPGRRRDGQGRHQQGVTAMLQVNAYASDRSLLIGLALDAGKQDAWSLGDEIFSYEPYALMLRRNDADFRLAVNRVRLASAVVARSTPFMIAGSVG